VNTKQIRLAALGAVAIGAPVVGLIGCELVASVDRNDIPGDTTTASGGGGTGGTTGGGGVGGTAYSMAQFGEDEAYNVRTVPLPAAGAEQVTMGIDLTWSEVASRPLPYDLSVELDGVDDALLQVFAIDDGPFARSGTRVESLNAGDEYRVEISRTAVAAWAQLVRLDDKKVLVSGPVVEIVDPDGDMVTIRTAKESPRVTVDNMRVWRTGRTE
jgi:hypothetical protein